MLSLGDVKTTMNACNAFIALGRGLTEELAKADVSVNDPRVKELKETAKIVVERLAAAGLA